MRLLQCRIRFCKVAFDLTFHLHKVECDKCFEVFFDLLNPLFDVSTSRMSNATFNDSTSHSTHIFLPNTTKMLRVAFNLLAILRYFWTTCRILASSMWNPSIKPSFIHSLIYLFAAPARATSHGGQWERAPPRKPLAGGYPVRQSYKRRGMCGSGYGYPASKISLGPLWI